MLLNLPEKAMAPCSSTLAWKIPWTEEPGGLQSMGSRRVRNDWVTSLSLFTFMHWRRQWQPTPVFLPGESQGWGSLVGCHLWGRKESNTTEWLHSLTPWKESYDQPRQHIKKKRYHFANKGLSSQGYGFSSSHVWMWELDYKESWVVKNWCFWTVVLEKTLKIPWTARRYNQSILKEISPGCSLEELMLKLKLQYFGHLMQTADSSEKTLMLGKIEWTPGVGVGQGVWRAAVPGVAKSWTRLSDWSELNSVAKF